jgi:hypothetical protein
LCADESGKFQQLRGVFHGPLAGESGNHVRLSTFQKSNDDAINSRHAIKKDALVKVDNHENSSCTSKSDYKSDLVQKLMLHNHGVGDGKFKSISAEPSIFTSARPRPNSISQCLVCRTVWGFELQMERMMLKLAGNFSIPFRAPNEDLKTPLESLDFLDVDRLFRHEKRIFYDREI